MDSTSHELAMDSTDEASYTSWAYEPQSGASFLAFALALIAACVQLRRGMTIRVRLGILVIAALAGLAIGGKAIAHTWAREHLAGAVQRAAAEVRISDATPTGDAESIGRTNRVPGMLAVPIRVRTWRGRWSPVPGCAQVTELPSGWRSGESPCSFLRADGLVQVIVRMSSGPDGTTLVQVRAQPGYPVGYYP